MTFFRHISSVIVIMCAAAVVDAQTPAPAAPPPGLQPARAVLDSVGARGASDDTAQKLRALREDFTSMESHYTQQLLNAASASESDWRVGYAHVESDLEDLIGSDGGEATGTMPGQTGVTDLDPATRAKLQQLRAALQTFYNATLRSPEPVAAMPPPASGQMAQPAAAPAACGPTGDLLPLLDRIESIVNEALGKTPSYETAIKTQGQGSQGGQMGTTGTVINGTTPNRIAIEREKLDEIRAEVDQLRLLLKR